MQLQCNRDLTLLSSKRLQFKFIRHQSNGYALYEVTSPLKLDDDYTFAGFVYARIRRCWGAEKYAFGLDRIPVGYIY